MGLQSYLRLALPYRIVLEINGFKIYHNRIDKKYALHLSPFTAEAVEEFLERGLILLNEDIKYINYLSGEKQLIGAQYQKLPEDQAFNNLIKSSKDSFWNTFLPQNQNYAVHECILDMSPFLYSVKNNTISKKGGINFDPQDKLFADRLFEFNDDESSDDSI